MKILFKISLLLALMTMSVVSVPTATAEADREQVKQMMLNMMRSKFEAICMETEQAQCLSMSESQCKAMTTDLVDTCVAPAFDDGSKPDEKKMQQCAEKIMHKHGIDEEKAKSCDVKTS